ncbi:MAG: hypothetical protein ACRDD1_06750, partial [Planctomycetia bacterium]
MTTSASPATDPGAVPATGVPAASVPAASVPALGVPAAGVPWNADSVGLAVHTVRERRAYFLALLVLLGAAVAPAAAVVGSAYRGSMDLHATIEMVGALFGLVTGFALVLRFYSLGNLF